MIQKFVDRFMESKSTLESKFKESHPDSYFAIVKAVIEVITSDDYSESPDPERIHEIDDGDYQGTILFVIGAKGCQPSDYWAVFVDYGSCSGCDTLQSIAECGYGPPTQEQVDQYMTLALHVVQGLKAI